MRFAGSVNHSSYLRDDSGGRRFWPVACGRIDVDRLTRDRDQVWAEAKARFERGCVWWLETTELVGMASRNKRIVTKEIPGKRSSAAGQKIVRVLRSPTCFCVASTSRKRCGHRWIRTAWRAASGRWAGNGIGSAREPNWNGAIEGSSNKCSQCSQSCSRLFPAQTRQTKDVPSVLRSTSVAANEVGDDTLECLDLPRTRRQ